MQALLPVEALVRKDRYVVVAGLIGVAGLAWAYTAYLAWDMQGMDMASARSMSMPMTANWTVGNFSLMFLMWAVMMIAMMIPSAAPMILTFGTVYRKRQENSQPIVPTAVFVSGYLLIWSAFALGGTLLQWGLHSATLLSPMTMTATPLIGGSLLLAAGLFQFSPIKYLCLTECRTPMSFLLTDWQEGRRGALTMGVKQGLYCLGCCWVLMSLLFVLGVMNLLWIAALAGFVLIEKVAPGRSWVNRISGGLLLAWGIWMILDSTL
jgi:predicted metal-binding membrane protein